LRIVVHPRQGWRSLKRVVQPRPQIAIEEQLLPVLAIDRGYNDSEWFRELTREEVYFVTRMKAKTVYEVQEELQALTHEVFRAGDRRVRSHMLTSGKWVETHAFWTGFFNPTYFPSLAVRTAIALALAGIYALVTASRLKDASLKARMVKWSAVWILPSMAVLPALIWWCIPSELWASAKGAMPTASHYAFDAAALAVVTFVPVLGTLIRPVRLHLAYSLLLLLAALGTMACWAAST
jgi:hypothetical protein